ncbi:MAG: serine hydrolase domain-containing protein, partial [Planctomycetota bacterium]
MTVSIFRRGCWSFAWCGVAVALLAGFLLASPAEADPSERVTSTLLPPFAIAGADDDVAGEVWTLEERMAGYAVPAVSVAVCIDGKLAWAKAWGLADREAGRAVDVDTQFQAASISKPVATIGVLRLVEAGKIGLDDPVNQHLKRWQIPGNTFTQQQPVTVRHVLGHRAGLTVHGFAG